MNTCPTCGQPLTKVNNILTIMGYPTNSIMVDGVSIRLTRMEMTIIKMLYTAMLRGDSPVSTSVLISAMYLLKADEPKAAEKSLTNFIGRLRGKFNGLNADILTFRDVGYSLVYEAREAA